jgi:hypothetical protein
MSIEITKNGAPAPSAMVTTSWVREDLANGRKRFRVFAMHLPLIQASATDAPLDVQHPRIAGAPSVIAEATLEVANLDVAKILYATIGQMIAKSAAGDPAGKRIRAKTRDSSRARHARE